MIKLWVPPPVAPMVSVAPSRLLPAAVVVDAVVRPRSARALVLPPTITPAVPFAVANVIWPLEMLEVTPAAASTVDNRSATLSPMPIVVPELGAAGGEREGDAVDHERVAGGERGGQVVRGGARGADSSVEPEIAAASRVVVVDGGAGDRMLVAVPSRLVAVAPVIAVEMTLDLVE